MIFAAIQAVKLVCKIESLHLVQSSEQINISTPGYKATLVFIKPNNAFHVISITYIDIKIDVTLQNSPLLSVTSSDPPPSFGLTHPPSPGVTHPPSI